MDFSRRTARSSFSCAPTKLESQLLLNFFHASEEFSEPVNPGNLLLCLRKRNCWTTEPDGTNHCAAVNDYVRAYPASLANCHAWINVTRGPDDRLVPDVASRADNCVITDSRAGLDDRVRLDGHTLSELSAGINDGGWVNPRRKCNRFGREFDHDLLESLGWICNANLSRSDRFSEVGWNKDCRCACFAQQPNVFSVCEEADFSRSRFPQ